jgi:hypothetical protein
MRWTCEVLTYEGGEFVPCRSNGPLDGQRPRDDVMRDVRRSTDDPAHLDWVSRVYDGTAVKRG